jgi:hypothetical protein
VLKRSQSPPARNPSNTPAALKEEDRLHSDSRIRIFVLQPTPILVFVWLTAAYMYFRGHARVTTHRATQCAASPILRTRSEPSERGSGESGADLLPVTVDHAIPGAAIYDALNIE